jgi:hypothetical protein
MKKYYKRGGSIYCLDIESDVIICVTNNENNKAIAHSFGYANSATLMNNSLSGSISQANVPYGGYPTLESNEEEFLSLQTEILQLLNQNLT